MSKHFNVNETAAGAGNSRAMEADTILKTRANLKSQISKGNFSLLIIALVAIMFSMVSCSGNGIPNGTYYDKSGNWSYTFSGNKFTLQGNGQIAREGTYETISENGVNFIYFYFSVNTLGNSWNETRKCQYIREGSKLSIDEELYIKK